MEYLKSFALVLIVLTGSFAMDETCIWLMDVLEMVTDSKDETEFRLHQHAIRVGNSYFVRLRISCENQVNPYIARSLVHSGYTPVTRLEISGYGLDDVMNTTRVQYADGVLVQFQQSTGSRTDLEGDFLMMNTSIPRNIPSNCTGHPSSHHEIFSYEVQENVLSPHCNKTHLCDLAWLVPLTVQEPNVVVKCFLTNPHEIQEASLMVHSRGMSTSDQNEVGEVVTDLPDGINLKKTMSIDNVPLNMPFWLVNGFDSTDYGFFTDSMFERTSVIKVYNVSQTGVSKVCGNPCSSLKIKQSSLLPDRILLSTCFGVQEIRHEVVGNTDKSSIVLRECIRRIIVPPQVFPGAVSILAIEESSAKVFVSIVSSGSDLAFLELKDAENRTLCQFLAADVGQGGDCIIQDASISQIPDVLYVFLVSYSSRYHIIGYSSNQWEIRFSFPSALTNITQENDEHGEHWTMLDSSSAGTSSVYLTGISFTRCTGTDLFVWGNVFFYSPNGGENFVWLRDYNRDSNISVFTSAEDGSYAFLTDSQQVWWGYIDSARVFYLETANEWNVGVMTSQEFATCDGPFNILSLFHDASGELWKVVHCKNQTSTTPCVFRRKVATQDILSHSQLLHEQTSLDDDVINTPSALDHGSNSTVSKHCVKYSISYQAPHTSHHLQRIVDVIDVPYMVNTVPVSVDFLKEYLNNQRNSLIRPNTLDISTTKDTLPRYIYLKTGETYNFTVVIILDDDHPRREYHIVMKV